MSANSVTLWMRNLESTQDSESAAPLFERYFPRVARYVRRKLGKTTRRVVDEEDIAIATMHVCLDKIQRGMLTALSNREQLWRMMATVASRQVIDLRRRVYANCRGGGTVRGESVFFHEDGSGISQVADKQSPIDSYDNLREDVRAFVASLEDDNLRKIAELSLAGLDTSEISKRVGRTRRTVQRRLRMLHDAWQEFLNSY
ncbi:ECF-type sigma factor [Bremerella sp. JC770]|uniref:ECF-type sigma factor n=1 Tax=Bremerella sp. JC770 TaxID=3232137 RepID=UPI0034574DEC